MHIKKKFQGFVKNYEKSVRFSVRVNVPMEEANFEECCRTASTATVGCLRCKSDEANLVNHHKNKMINITKIFFSAQKFVLSIPHLGNMLCGIKSKYFVCGSPVWKLGVPNRVSNPYPDPIRIQGLNDQKLGKIYSKKNNLTIYLTLGLHKGSPSYKRSLQLSKENIQHFKTWNFLIFSYFCRSLLPSWIRIRIQQLKLMRIHADLDPDPQPWSHKYHTWVTCYALSNLNISSVEAQFESTGFCVHYVPFERPLWGGAGPCWTPEAGWTWTPRTS